MLPRIYKLTKKRDIENLAKTGRRLGSVFFNVKYKKSAHTKERYLIVVSAKVSKKAVERNKVRRRVREIIRTEMLGDLGGFDIMVVVKDSALRAGFDALKSDLLNLLVKIK